MIISRRTAIQLLGAAAAPSNARLVADGSEHAAFAGPVGSFPADNSRAGLFLAFDASGNPFGSRGTGSDAGLRTDLAGITGAHLVKVATGDSLQSRLDQFFTNGPSAPTAGSVMQIDKVHSDGLADPSNIGSIWSGFTYAGTAFGKRFTKQNASDGLGESPAIGVLNYAEAFGTGRDVVAHMAISYARASNSTVFAGNDIVLGDPSLVGVRYIGREFDIQPHAGTTPANGCGGAFFNAFSVSIPGNATQVDGIFGGSWANGHVVYSATAAAFVGGADGHCGSLIHSGNCSYDRDTAFIASNSHRFRFSGTAHSHWELFSNKKDRLYLKFGADLLGFLNASESAMIAAFDADGSLAIGANGSVAAGYKLDVAADMTVETTGIADFKSSTGIKAAEINVAVGLNGSAAQCAMRLRANSSTLRSLNAGGTINASGKDYAEYERLAPGISRIAKGDVVGFRADGLLTDRFEEAVRFGIKSTNPNLVGGDAWAADLDDAPIPIPPRFDPPRYAGVPEPSPDAPRALVSEEEARMRIEASAAAHALLAAREAKWPVEQLAALEEAAASAQAAIVPLRAARATATDALVKQWEFAKAQRAADLKTFETQVEKAYAAWNATAVPLHEAALAAHVAAIDEARAPLERIAYCGKVPANLNCATPGQFVIAVSDGTGGIALAALDYSATTAEQRDLYCVGRVNRLLEDGRAEVVVKAV